VLPCLWTPPQSYTITIYNTIYIIYIHIHVYSIYIYVLVGGFNPSEKYEFINWDDEIPNWMESHKSHVPTHQPVCIYIYILYAYNLSPYIIYIHYHLSPYIYNLYTLYTYTYTIIYYGTTTFMFETTNQYIYIYIISYIYNTYTLIYHISSTYTDIYSSIQKSTFTLLPAWSGGFVITSAKLPVKLPAMKLNSTSTAKIRATLRRRYSFAFIWVCLKIVYP